MVMRQGFQSVPAPPSHARVTISARAKQRWQPHLRQRQQSRSTCAAAEPALPSYTHQAGVEQLDSPIKIEGRASHTVVVTQEQGAEVSLDTFMRLPVQAYSALDEDIIQPLGGSHFLLRLPRLSLFSVWVAPEVEVSVTPAGPLGSPPCILLEACSCLLVGSPFFAKLENRFRLQFSATLAWHPAGDSESPFAELGSGQHAESSESDSSSDEGGPSNASSASSSSCDQSGLSKASSASSSNSSSNDGAGAWGFFLRGSPVAAVAETGLGAQQGRDLGEFRGEIRGELTVEVWAEPIPPFHSVPRGVLQRGGNAVLGALIQALLPLFLRRLGEDYEKWSKDAEYRDMKAAATVSMAPAVQQ